MKLTSIVDWRGDLVATAVGFGGQATIKLLSSVILTKLLAPSAYGIVTIALSITFTLELLADVNVGLFVIRDTKGEDRRYLDTAWTMRLSRSILNAAILFFAAPIIATRLYATPELTAPLRLIALCFVLGGMASMGFTLAIRRNNARAIIYSELLAAAITTVFTIVYSYFSRDYWGLITGIVLNKALISGMSHFFYRDFAPNLSFDWAAAKEILQFTKYTMPSSLITIGLTQFDKVVLLRLFDLPFVGIYGVAGNISGPIDTLISTTTQRVLYPRCAKNYREDPTTFTIKYYTENIRLFAFILFIPATLLGASHLIINFLYDPRYGAAAVILQAFALRSIVSAFVTSAEDFLVASGSSKYFSMGIFIEQLG